ncbi:hypothetical protein IQ264_30630 [Phormidium sp. LEGE 05292]|uniref:hypothetical protein n=1 Tax=[Phormidium] sp. LEGE 05292 TaxID=767427 RepID=UPI001882B6E6|nr:hypothetical protein [Phormidium sp. LEGE 05292]MBE9229763.1 hypothetical protein [Phormidium sp. LEGE 05292]
MLSVFASELNSTQSELDTLLAKVEALRSQMKSLKAAQNKAFKVVDHLKNLVSELPELAIAELKKEILSLFPIDPEPAEVFTNFVTEVPETEVTTPKIAKNEEVNDRWNPAHFGDLHFNAEDNGQLNLLQPTTTEPPEPDDYPNLASFEAAWTEWKMQQEGEAEEELAHVCAKDFAKNLIDLSGENWEQLKAALKPVRQPAPVEEEAHDDDQWPEVEPAPKTTDNNYAQTEYLNDTLCYIKKYDGEVLAAYIGTATKKLAQEWADLLVLWGCNASARKAERIGRGIRWEVKITKISMEQLITAANNHPGLYSGVPQGNAEYTKKSTTGNAGTKENLEESKTPVPQSNLQPEKSEISTEAKAAEDAEVIYKGEQAKADILPNYSQQNQQKVFAGDLIRVKSNCHHKSVIGLTGVVTVASQAGCIAKFEEIGNRWLTNDQVEIVKESRLVG